MNAAPASASLPVCCSPRAFSLLGQQVAVLDSPDALLNGALSIAMHELDWVDPSAADAKIQHHADTIRSRVRGSQPQALLAHLHHYLFDEQGFIGNSEDYYNPHNSYLPATLEAKRGLPITLCLIYTLIAQRLGIRAWGVGLPGHFLAGVQSDQQEEGMLVDCFAGGRLLTADDAHQRMRERFGPEVEWTEELLRPVTHRHWLTRMLQNLLSVFGSAGRYADVAAVLEMEMLLWPDQEQLQRDLALVLARVGLTSHASAWLERYLQGNPDDPQVGDLRQLLDVLTT